MVAAIALFLAYSPTGDQRKREERGRSGQVPFLLAERARWNCARLGQERVLARSGLGG
jgi:hypothetical protein